MACPSISAKKDSHSHCPVADCPRVFCKKTDKDLIQKAREHYNTHHLHGAFPSSEWLALTESKMCTRCQLKVVAATKFAHSTCRPCGKALRAAPEVAPVPVADMLPPILKDPTLAEHQVKFTEVLDVPFGDAGGMPAPLQEPHSEALKEICKADVPIMKYVPPRLVAPFAALWSSEFAAAKLSGKLDDWVRVFRLPKAILLSPQRAGARLSKQASFSKLVSERMAVWKEGYEGRERLWGRVLLMATLRKSRLQAAKAAGLDQKVPTTKSLEAKVTGLLHEGDTKKAIQSLTSAPIAEVSDATAAKMRELHPPSPPVPPPTSQLPPAPKFSEATVRAALCSFNPCAAGGLFGYKPALLQQCMKADSFHFPQTLTGVVNMFANGDAPAFLKPFVAGGTAIALKKGADAIRPLCSGDPLRRLTAKCVCLAGKDEMAAIFKGMNFGVGCPGGTEVVAHSLRDVLKKNAEVGGRKVLLKVDFKNAFNTIKRTDMLEKACEYLPGLSRWSYWCYDQPSLLLYGHEYELESAGGSQQGDPLAPFYYCCPLQDIIKVLKRLDPTYNKWYMDDGAIVGEIGLVQQAWDIVCKMGPRRGMFPNITKTECSWLDRTNTEACPIVTHIFDADGEYVLDSAGAPVLADNDITLVPTDEIQILGVPIGSTAAILAHVRKKLNDGKTGKILAQLCDFDSPQVASFLLRTSYCSVKATHFQRGVPPEEWAPEAALFDLRVRDAAETIHGFPITNNQWSQASTSTSMGGLSLRSCEEHALGAYAASWNEAKKTVGEEGQTWDIPRSIVGVPRRNQKSASHAKDVTKIDHLLSIYDEASKANLKWRQEPHANTWVSAVPSYVDGFDYRLDKRHFGTAVKLLLRAPIHPDGIPCPYCELPMNKYGDHALSCRKSGDTVTRHNRQCNHICKIADHGKLAPHMEKKGILGDDASVHGQRPADIGLENYARGNGLAMDVAVISAVADSRQRDPHPLEDYATLKHRKYDKAFEDVPYDFVPIIFSTGGGINQQGTDILKQLYRFAAKQTGERYSVYCAKAWVLLSVTLQRSVAQQVLNCMPPSYPDGDTMLEASEQN